MATASVVPSGGTSLLLEREVQVAALRALADAAKSGGGRFVVIEGTAGIGKTRLLAEGRAIAGSAGMRVLAARGGELHDAVHCYGTACGSGSGSAGTGVGTGAAPSMRSRGSQPSQLGR